MAYEKLSLVGRVAVVTGGSSGIGRAIALGLAQAGADVVPTSRQAGPVEQVCAEIEHMGRRTLRFTADVTSRAALEELQQQCRQQLGRVDILVNSAGTTQKSPTLDVTDEEWERVLECNLSGTLRACQIFGRAMIEQGYGRIINIASISTTLALYQVAAYGASKAAVGALTKSLGLEWGKLGVNVNAIAPGVFRTELNKDLLDGTERGKEFKLRTPLGRFGQLDELVGAAIFLASESASFVNGHILAVDGGFMASGVNN
jgi:NAD(P)-dependent dehydrogenase (short-subunit alcohol dehydrogenase family)